MIKPFRPLPRRAAAFLAVAAITMTLCGCLHQHRALVGDNSPGGVVSPSPHRILCLAPCITETVFALGLGNRVVGVTDYCRYPQEARKRRRVGGLLNPNYETMFVLNPDLTILLPCEAEVGRRLSTRGIRCLTVPNESIKDVYTMIGQIGRATGTENKANALIETLRSDLRKVVAPPGLRRPSVLISTSRQPGSLKSLYAMGPGTFLHELLALVGGRNVMGDSGIKYPMVSLEELITRDPDLIIEMQSNDQLPDSDRNALITDWHQLPRLSAVIHHQVHVLAADYLMIPGPRIAQTARSLRNLLDQNRSQR